MICIFTILIVSFDAQKFLILVKSIFLLLPVHMHPNVYGSTIDNIQSMERAKLSIDWWMDKENEVCVCVCVCVCVRAHNGILLGNEKNEILPFVTTWMELKYIMLSEISQSEKDIWFHSYVEFQKQKMKIGERQKK